MAKTPEPAPQIALSPIVNTRLRDMEDRQRILRDRVLLVGQSLVESREKNFSDIQEMKKTIFALKEENKRMKELITRMTEQISQGARKEELMILQRQFDLFRKE